MNAFNRNRANEALGTDGKILAIVSGTGDFHLQDRKFTQGVTLPITKGGGGFLDIDARSADELVNGLIGEMIDNERRFLHTNQTAGAGANLIYNFLLQSDQEDKADEFKSIVTGKRRSYFFDPKQSPFIDEDLNIVNISANQFSSAADIQLLGRDFGTDLVDPVDPRQEDKNKFFENNPEVDKSFFDFTPEDFFDRPQEDQNVFLGEFNKITNTDEFLNFRTAEEQFNQRQLEAEARQKDQDLTDEEKEGLDFGAGNLLKAGLALGGVSLFSKILESDTLKKAIDLTGRNLNIKAQPKRSTPKINISGLLNQIRGGFPTENTQFQSPERFNLIDIPKEKQEIPELTKLDFRPQGFPITKGGGILSRFNA